jgi:RNAse (barnase) inhibitor barstar
MSALTVHGIDYKSKDAIRDRIKELHSLNSQLGASDGRVTEIDALFDCLKRNRPQAPVFSIYYRTATGKKGRKDCDSREKQARFIRTTPHAVTFFS